VYWSLRPHCGFDQGWDGPWFSSEIMHHLVHTSISSGGAYYNFTQMTWQVGGLMVRRATQYWLSTVASNPGNTNQALVGLRHSSSAGPWGVSQIYYLHIWHLQNQAREDVSVSEGTLKDAEGVCSPLLAEQTPGCSNCWTTGRRPLQDQVQIRNWANLAHVEYFLLGVRNSALQGINPSWCSEAWDMEWS